MEEALIALLLADSSLAALVGSRINWADRVQGEGLPAITLSRISGVRDYANDGPSGLVTSRVQIDCDAESYLAAAEVARAVIAALPSAPVTQDGIQFQGVFVDGERDLYEADALTANALRPIGKSLDLMVHHSE